MRKTPSFGLLAPASERSSRSARAASRKTGTHAEVALRQALWNLGLRYRVNVRALPGSPDIVFSRARVVVFVDGDFWHGRDLESRIAKLKRGHNAGYWVAKVLSNVRRDREQDSLLTADGWVVLRYWSTEVEVSSSQIASAIASTVRTRGLQKAGLRAQG